MLTRELARQGLRFARHAGAVTGGWPEPALSSEHWIVGGSRRAQHSATVDRDALRQAESEV